jgi:predicted GIY-YIG superfamily endonuclease
MVEQIKGLLGFGGSKCRFWNCAQSIQPNYFLCSEHYELLQLRQINQCPGCKRYKLVKYDLCLDCNDGKPVNSPKQSAESKLTTREPPHPVNPVETTKPQGTFYVYILKLDGGDFYVGSTDNIRPRVSEHKDGKHTETKGKNPRLQWFTTAPTRREANALEAELKKLEKSNPRKIREMIFEFQDVVEELKFDT